MFPVFVASGCDSADRYVVLGAQRDAWGKGYAKATVGTSVLVELAKAVQEMVEKGNNCNTESITSSTCCSVGGVTKALLRLMSSRVTQKTDLCLLQDS